LTAQCVVRQDYTFEGCEAPIPVEVPRGTVVLCDSDLGLLPYGLDMGQIMPGPSPAIHAVQFEEVAVACPESDAGSITDRLLFEDFMRARGKCRGALVALNERLMIMNLAAGDVLSAAERPRLWELAKDARWQNSPQIRELSLSNGKSVIASHRPVVRNGAFVGILVQFSVPDRALSAQLSVEDAGLGPSSWQTLTKTERQVAEVIAGGLPNREAGRRVYISPHTVDAHLRHIFRKLGISSRVELARIVGQLQREVPGPERGELATAARRCHPSQRQPFGQRSPLATS
jgi:DNA-binding CsgD family transcriptional regulator